MAIDASDEAIGRLLPDGNTADARLDSSDVALVAGFVAAIDNHEVVIHLVKDRLLPGDLGVVAATAAT